MNDGARQLAATGASTAEIGTACGCSRESARRWRTGAKVPGRAKRVVLFNVYGIDPEAWDRRGPAAADADPAPVASTALTADDGVELPPLQAARAHLARATVWRIEAAESGSDAAFARAFEGERKAIETLARIERDRGITIEKILDHDEWKRMAAAILDGLQPYPGALAALIVTLAVLEGEGVDQAERTAAQLRAKACDKCGQYPPSEPKP